MLKIDNLEKEYKGFHLNCSLEVRPGSITGLVGPNGSGKSTIFKSILGLIRPDSGNITVFGRDASQLTAKEKEDIGAVFVESGFSGWLSIRDIISIMDSMYSRFDRAGFIARCESSGLPFDKKLKDLSTGMKAKLKVLLALSHQAKFFILDEPAAGLDVIARGEIMDLIRDAVSEDENRSVLISSHIASDLETICDDLYMIRNGNIVFHEDTDTLLHQYGVLKITPGQYEKIDRRHLLRIREESFGFSCLTGERAFYAENYPDIVIEKANIDEMITMMVKGKEV